VCTFDQFERHSSSSVQGIFCATGRAESGMTVERRKFKFTTMRASKHGATIGRIPAVYHLLNVFHNNRSRMESILNFFVIIGKDVLEYIHRTIMKEKGRKRNPLPLKNEGQGS